MSSFVSTILINYCSIFRLTHGTQWYRFRCICMIICLRLNWKTMYPTDENNKILGCSINNVVYQIKHVFC